MKEAYYSVQYFSHFGNGIGVVAFDTNKLVGADITGGIWDGTYEYNQKTGEIDLNVKLTLPNGIFSAASGNQSDGSLVENFKLSIPNIELGQETQHIISVFNGISMRLVIKKIRDLDTW